MTAPSGSPCGMNRLSCLLRPIIMGAAAWEAVAIPSKGRLPTWTRLAWRYRRNPIGLAVILVVWGYLGYHLLIEGRRPRAQ